MTIYNENCQDLTNSVFREYLGLHEPKWTKAHRINSYRTRSITRSRKNQGRHMHETHPRATTPSSTSSSSGLCSSLSFLRPGRIRSWCAVFRKRAHRCVYLPRAVRWCCCSSLAKRMALPPLQSLCPPPSLPPSSSSSTPVSNIPRHALC